MMIFNENTDYDVYNSSTFVGYADYTSSSLTNYCLPISPVNIGFQKNPTIITLKAMEEANKKEELKYFSTVEDFFEDLES